MNDDEISKKMKKYTIPRTAARGMNLVSGALGHASTKTTEIYTHVSFKKLQNFPNPLDDL